MGRGSTGQSWTRGALVMAGGTGGHVYPALAVARSCANAATRVVWFGTDRGLEARVVPEAGLPLHLLRIKGIRGKGLPPVSAACWHSAWLCCRCCASCSVACARPVPSAWVATCLVRRGLAAAVACGCRW